MEFQKITEDTKIRPGEYILHKPSQQIVVCGAYKYKEGTIKAIVGGRLMEDKIENFQKIKLSLKERRERKAARCGKCGK